MGVKNCWKTGE